MADSDESPIHVVLIGDGYVGKTSILNALKQSGDDLQRRNTDANLYGELRVEKEINKKHVHFKFIDTAGQEEYDEFRKTYYDEASMFILCFCVADKVSYDNILARWIIEIHRHRSKPMILVGTKLDLRKNGTNDSVSTERGIRLQKKIGARFYIECSSVTSEGINEIVDAASQLLTSQQNKKSSCILQ